MDKPLSEHHIDIMEGVLSLRVTLFRDDLSPAERISLAREQVDRIIDEDDEYTEAM